MKKFILVATALSAVALSSGCTRTVVVRSHPPAEVVEHRTVVHETDVRVHRDAPRTETRVIRKVYPSKPEPVYVPVPRDRRDSRYYRDEHPRPPAHSNSRYYRDKAPRDERRYDDPRYRDARDRDDVRYRDDRRETPSRAITIHGDSAISRAMQEAQQRRLQQAPPSVRDGDVRRDRDREVVREREVIRERQVSPSVHQYDNRRQSVRPQSPTREIRRTPVTATTRPNNRPAAEPKRTASPKSVQEKPSLNALKKKREEAAKSKAKKNAKHQRSGDDKEDDKENNGKGNGRSDNNDRD